MNHRTRGIALISILAVAATLLVILSVGLRLGSDGVLYTSQAHQRNVALAAAEAGVYEAMLELESDKGFQGTKQGILTDSKADYEYTVQNNLAAAGIAVVESTGEYGQAKRTLRVELVPDASSFDAISLRGKVYVFDQAYINGIAEPGKPIVRPGNAHSEHDGSDSFIGRDFDGNGRDAELRVSGDLTAKGTFDSDLDTIQQNKNWGTSKPPYRLDKAEMLSGSFTTVGSPPSGTVSTNTRVSGDTVFNSPVHIPKGVTLHVEGNAEFLGGLTGEGQVVVDGEVKVFTGADFDPTVKEGVKLYTDDTAIVTHPTTEVDGSDGTFEVEMDPVGDYFARMPGQASRELANGIPTDAPRGAEFFGWVQSSSSSPDQQFDLWYNGDGTEIYPGLSQETKDWLQDANPSQIEAWAANN